MKDSFLIRETTRSPWRPVPTINPCSSSSRCCSLAACRIWYARVDSFDRCGTYVTSARHVTFLQRVPGKVARVLGDGDGAVLVAGALGKVWRVEVRRERGGGGKEEGEEEKAFLARGWAEFARAHGLGVGWFLVFRHEGRGVLSVKAFDTSLCLREFGTPCTGTLKIELP